MNNWLDPEIILIKLRRLLDRVGIQPFRLNPRIAFSVGVVGMPVRRVAGQRQGEFW